MEPERSGRTIIESQLDVVERRANDGVDNSGSARLGEPGPLQRAMMKNGGILAGFLTRWARPAGRLEEARISAALVELAVRGLGAEVAAVVRFDPDGTSSWLASFGPSLRSAPRRATLDASVTLEQHLRAHWTDVGGEVLVIESEETSRPMVALVLAPEHVICRDSAPLDLARSLLELVAFLSFAGRPATCDGLPAAEDAPAARHQLRNALHVLSMSIELASRRLPAANDAAHACMDAFRGIIQAARGLDGRSPATGAEA